MAERKRSAVWTLFTQLRTLPHGMCAGKSLWNTSNLHKHIKAVHPRENSRAAKIVEEGGRQTRPPRSLAEALQPEIRNIQPCHRGAFNHLGDFSLGDKRVHPESPPLCFHQGMRDGRIEEILEVLSLLRRPIMSSVEPGPAGRLAPRYPSVGPQSPTSQPQPIGLLLQLDSIPYRRCPLPRGSGTGRRDSTADLTAAATGSSIDIDAENMGPLWTLCLHIPRNLVKLSRRWELNTSLAGALPDLPSKTLTMRLGLPSLSGFLLLQRIQLTTRW
ncbi:hypothetical protein CRENBAI_006889 [Crenichthys baileyi]|uniref:Uncharacterized protein n=1 Tax=Crenichthys baileyi TaxID=28760 RepID=A0AAV9RC03_9TELE